MVNPSYSVFQNEEERLPYNQISSLKHNIKLVSIQFMSYHQCVLDDMDAPTIMLVLEKDGHHVNSSQIRKNIVRFPFLTQK